MSRGKILVVDDEQEIVISLSMRLKANQYEVITANDSYVATKKATQEYPDLIILDIGMPCKSGHEVVKTLRQNAKTRDIPVIFLTAHTSSKDYKEAIENGVEKYITKPFLPEELMGAIDELLSQPRAEVQSGGLEQVKF
ncbi:MAG: response regulator [Planctomycetota bacterium]